MEAGRSQIKNYASRLATPLMYANKTHSVATPPKRTWGTRLVSASGA